MDIASIGGIVLAIVGILGGMMIEGGNIIEITQPTAAMIVIGGTAGAVHAAVPAQHLPRRAQEPSSRSSCTRATTAKPSSQQLVGFANKARKSGIVSLDADLDIDPRSVPEAGPHARRRRHRAQRSPQDHGARTRQQIRDRREDPRRLRGRRRLLPHRRHHRRRPRPHPGHEEPRRHRRGRHAASPPPSSPPSTASPSPTSSASPPPASSSSATAKRP